MKKCIINNNQHKGQVFNCYPRFVDNKRKSLDTISQISGSPSGYGPSVCSKGNEYHVISVIFRSLITKVVMSYKELKHPENSVSTFLV